jgi:hypothetical protein
MKRSQLARLDAFRRMQSFLDANAAVLGNVNRAVSRLELDAAVTRLTADGARQERAITAATSLTKMKGEARDDLRLHHMQQIAAIARRRLAGAPAIQDLRLPHKSTSDAALIVKANAMAAAAAPYTQLFVAQQLPADFIAQLRAAAQAVLAVISVRGAALVELHMGTRNVRDQLAITYTDVKVLNALVVKQLKGRSGLLEAWRIAKRIKAKPGVPAGTAVVHDGDSPAHLPG